MNAYKILTSTSDYPYLVIANSIRKAIDTIIEEKDKTVYNEDKILNISLIDEYSSSNIIIQK